MAVARVPQVLAERLGEKGTEGLLTLLASTKAEWADDVVTSAVERFERRLTAEISSLRVDYTREMATLRQDVNVDLLALRQDMAGGLSALRQDMTEGISALRQDVTRDLSNVRVELLKWSFLFWVGQVAAVAGLLAFMLRA